ncbi:hypothetical protein [Nevskia sp.]|uniref:hypothetical protein n=1 Tax=Nevskia sp. TaxID=1929292 RepID=UPI0025E52ED1|nr:hypothetical protein [Nevskia sp.]HET7797716.1 hypothetical protein [Nevskia sp.]
MTTIRNRLTSHGENPILLYAAAVTAAVAFHMSFALALIKAGTDGENVYASQDAAPARLVADLGTLPTIHVYGRRAG